jgi:fimbrial isopeptide formation D2 family protein
MIEAIRERSCRILALAACVLMALMLTPVNAFAGEVTISGTNARAYKAYQVFDADVAYSAEQQKDVASNISWASDAARSAAESAAGRSFATAQDAAGWMQQSLSDGNEADYRLAKALIASGATATDLTAGKAAELSEGYWLVVADDSALGVSEAGTAPVFVLVGTGSKTVEPKSSVPTVEKHVQENSTGKWQKAADATVGDDVFWRLEATVHAGLEGYDSYRVWFEDRMSEGLDPSRVSSSAKVYLVAGTGSSFDGATSWTDITGQCTVTVKGQTFEIESPDLVAALGSDVLGSQGAQVCVIYSAPLNQQCNHGAAEGNPNTVHLEYPKSPLSGSERSKTPDSKATAYTWNLQLTKRSKEGDAVLSGAVLDIEDPSGRHLSQDGSWTTNGSTVTTDNQGHVTLSGIDSGTYLISEIQAPQGYERFEGTRKIVLTVSGLDVKQVASAHPELSIQAEDPLRADAIDSTTSLLQASILDTPTPPGETPPGTTPPKEGNPDMGDISGMEVAALLAMVGIALAIVAWQMRKHTKNDRN